MDKLISIITPVYNAEDYINECIKSVLNQTYVNWELILIDDCSTDNSINIIRSYLSDNRIKLFKNDKNKGPALTRNIGLNNAKGDYITFLDSDDFWAKEHLKNQIHFMLKNQLMISHGNYYFCDLDSNILKTVKVDEKIDYAHLLKGNQFRTTSMILKRELIGEHRFENIKHEDYAFFLECLKRTDYSLANINDVSSFYRIGNAFSVSSNKLKSAVWTWNIYYKHLKLGLLKSAYFFLHYAVNGILKYFK